MFDEGDVVVTPDGPGTVLGYGRQRVTMKLAPGQLMPDAAREYVTVVEVLLHDGELVTIVDDEDTGASHQERHGTLKVFSEDVLSPEG